MPFSFQVEVPQVFIRDIGSANGTFVNGKRLGRPATASEPHPVQSGDIVVGYLFVAETLA